MRVFVKDSADPSRDWKQNSCSKLANLGRPFPHWQ